MPLLLDCFKVKKWTENRIQESTIKISVLEAHYWIPAFTLRFLCFLNISFLSVCLWSITLLYIISFFMLPPFLFLSHSHFVPHSLILSLASLRSAVLSVGMLFAGLLFHIRISTRSMSGRGIFCPLLSGARPSRPLACLGGHSAHKHRVKITFLSNPFFSFF